MQKHGLQIVWTVLPRWLPRFAMQTARLVTLVMLWQRALLVVGWLLGPVRGKGRVQTALGAQRSSRMRMTLRTVSIRWMATSVMQHGECCRRHGAFAQVAAADPVMAFGAP
jgi:hypothetical protein